MEILPAPNTLTYVQGLDLLLDSDLRSKSNMTSSTGTLGTLSGSGTPCPPSPLKRRGDGGCSFIFIFLSYPFPFFFGLPPILCLSEVILILFF